MTKEVKDIKQQFEKEASKKKTEKYMFNLYIAGTNRRSLKAVENIKRILDENLKVKYELNIIDIFQQPLFAKEGQIVAAPTLIKKLPAPVRRLIGDLSSKEKVLAGLEIRESKGKDDTEDKQPLPGTGKKTKGQA